MEEPFVAIHSHGLCFLMHIRVLTLYVMSIHRLFTEACIYCRQSDNVRAEATRNFLNNLLDWNNGARLAWEACVRLGVWREPNLFNASTVRTLSPRGGSESRGNRCFPLYYELLVQRPELWMRSLFRFLELPFDARVLRHHEHIGRPGGVRLSECARHRLLICLVRPH